MKKLFLILIVLVVGFCLFAEDVSVSLEDSVSYPVDWRALSKEERNLKILNVLTSISTQKGLQYISRRAGYKPKTLFEDSYCISDLEKKNSRIEDPVFTTLTDKYTLFAYQKDNRFGGNTYKVEYLISEDSVELIIVNYTPIRFAGVTCVKSGDLTMRLKIEQGADDIHITGSAFVPNQKAKISFVFYTVDLDSSFTRRVEALKNWFVERIGVTE